MLQLYFTFTNALFNATITIIDVISPATAQSYNLIIYRFYICWSEMQLTRVSTGLRSSDEQKQS